MGKVNNPFVIRSSMIIRVTWVSLLCFLVLRKRNSPSLSRRERLLFRPEPGVELCLGVGEGMGFRGEVAGNLGEENYQSSF